MINRKIKVKLSRDGKEMETKSLRINVNGIRYLLNIEVDGKLRINKHDDTESAVDIISINPFSGNVIDLY